VVEGMNDAPPRVELGNAEVIDSEPVLYCKVTTALVTVSLAGMFRDTGMPPLRGLGGLLLGVLNTRLIESDAIVSGPRAKSGMLTVTALDCDAATKKFVT